MEQPNRGVASASLAAAGLSAVNDLAYSGRLRYGATASRYPNSSNFVMLGFIRISLKN